MDEITAKYPGGPGRGVVFATGTPISNSMAELYTMMRYLQHEMLERKGWAFFDAWAAQFGETVTAIELRPEGSGYRQKTRFARFYNLPELMNYWKEVTDVQTADMLKLPVPKANYHNVVAKPTMLQREMVKALGERAEEIHRGNVDPSVDNMLKITNDGRNLALDQRQMNSMYSDDPESKVNACVSNVLRIWRDTTETRSAQMIFCDLSTPKPQVKDIKQVGSDGAVTLPPFSVYHDIKQKLVAYGVPENEVVFIHDAHTDLQKAELFAKVRAGDVRGLLGSTSKMGAGTNAQTKLKGLHHLDVPWRPSDIEQREGRILRQGNENAEVDIYRYVTEGTFDAYSWQLIETKQRFIGQIMTSKSPARSYEDVDITALSYAEVKALSAGNPKIKERMDLEVEVAKLTLLRGNFQSEHYRIEDQLLKKFPAQIATTQQHIKAHKADMELAAANVLPADTFHIEIGSKLYEKKEPAGEALISIAKTVQGLTPVHVGKYRGFDMEVVLDSYNNVYRVQLMGAAAHNAHLGSDPLGNITRINNVLERFPEILTTYLQELDTLNRQMDEAKAELTRPWAQEAEWKKKSTRLNKLNVELNMELSEAGGAQGDDTGRVPDLDLQQDYELEDDEMEEEL